MYRSMDRVDVLATVGYHGTHYQFSIHTHPSYHHALILICYSSFVHIIDLPRFTYREAQLAGQGIVH